MRQEYLDIINLPHHVSLNHKRMSNSDRAAQFAPFAALTGYEALIREMARVTQTKLTLSTEKVAEISKVLSYLKEHIKESVAITIIFFRKDEKKNGGEYIKYTGLVKKIDEYHKTIKVDDITIKFNDIYEIELVDE